MTKFIGTLLLLFVGASARADDWTLVRSEAGIEVFKRDVPGSRLTAMKGHGFIDAPLWKVAAILLDTNRAPEWVDSLRESRVVRRLDEDRYIEYNHVGGTFLTKDRDFVSQVRIDVDPTAKEFALVYAPAEDPVAPVTRYVRGEIVEGLFQARWIPASGRTELTVELQCDPKGALPSWVVNFFQRKWPVHTFEAIRVQAAKPDIRIPSEFFRVLEPTQRF
jgi:hypothetical protein